jgi:hypothetical protein
MRGFRELGINVSASFQLAVSPTHWLLLADLTLLLIAQPCNIWNDRLERGRQAFAFDVITCAAIGIGKLCWWLNRNQPVFNHRVIVCWLKPHDSSTRDFKPLLDDLSFVVAGHQAAGRLIVFFEAAIVVLGLSSVGMQEWSRLSNESWEWRINWYCFRRQSVVLFGRKLTSTRGS